MIPACALVIDKVSLSVTSSLSPPTSLLLSFTWLYITRASTLVSYHPLRVCLYLFPFYPSSCKSMAAEARVLVKFPISSSCNSIYAEAERLGQMTTNSDRTARANRYKERERHEIQEWSYHLCRGFLRIVDFGCFTWLLQHARFEYNHLFSSPFCISVSLY